MCRNDLYDIRKHRQRRAGERQDEERGGDMERETGRGDLTACSPEVGAFPVEAWACRERPEPGTGLHLPPLRSHPEMTA